VIGDRYAWNFESTFIAANGSSVHAAWTDDGPEYLYVVDELWVNAPGGYRALNY